jgi:hypothetical protein
MQRLSAAITVIGVNQAYFAMEVLFMNGSIWSQNLLAAFRGARHHTRYIEYASYSSDRWVND